MTDNVVNDTSTDSSAPASKKRWYVVHAYSGMEKSVQRALQERIEREGLQHLFGQILVPSEEVMESKSGRKTVTERRLFPGYVFVEMEMTDETWHLVKNTSKVTGFIGGTGNRPSPISKSEVDKIMAQIKMPPSPSGSQFNERVSLTSSMLSGAASPGRGASPG